MATHRKQSQHAHLVGESFELFTLNGRKTSQRWRIIEIRNKVTLFAMKAPSENGENPVWTFSLSTAQVAQAIEDGIMRQVAS